MTRKTAGAARLHLAAAIDNNVYQGVVDFLRRGEVIDKESREEPFSETSTVLNPNLRGRDICDTFETEEYQLLLVASKFQTGFDSPMLCGMYVDRRLDGIQAVR